MMVNNQTKGPAQIFSLDIASINYALRDLSERLDEQSGLRGRASIYDRTRVDSPTVATDAVDLQSLVTQQSRTRMDWITPPNGVLVSAPGTSYAEVDSALRQPLDFANLTSPTARIIIFGWGTESGTGKGVALHDGTSTLAEVTWDGQTEAIRTGDFTDLSLTADTTLRLYTKGSSATEDLILNMVVVEFQVSINVVST